MKGVAAAKVKAAADAEAAAAAAAEAAAVGEAVTDAAATATATATATTTATAATTTPIRMTARIRAGRQLRADLRDVNKLKRKSGKAVDDAMAVLVAAEPELDADAARKQTSTAKLRALDTRDTLFSCGGLSLTQEVLRRFLNMPEVKALLSKELRARQMASVDANVSALLLDTAKSFIRNIYTARNSGKGGRRSDTNRNALAAGLAQLLLV